MTSARFITIPFSHYCEKARWALDYATIDYVEEGHVPGFHRLAVRRAKSAHSSVPVLVVDDRSLGDSRDILAWANARAPAGREIYPTDEALKAEVLALENRFDTELGPHIRRVLYFHVLSHTRLAFEFMDPRTPLWERAALRATSPLLFRGMRRFMRIDRSTAEVSLMRVQGVFDEVEARMADGRRFLVGDRFTAADLTFAALVGLAVMPSGHFVRFPNLDVLPRAARQILEDIQARPLAAYVARMYGDHRPRPRAG
jgi:glutathione S-transferase